MAVRVGLDLVDVATVVASIDAHGDRYLNRIYTDEERDDCGMDTSKLAARFAAKEATMKALGRSDEPMAWQSIEVVPGPGRGVGIVLHGPARALARRRGITRLSLSLGASGASAMALVIGEAAA